MTHRLNDRLERLEAREDGLASLTMAELDNLIAALEGEPPADHAHLKRLEALAQRIGAPPEIVRTRTF